MFFCFSTNVNTAWYSGGESHKGAAIFFLPGAPVSRPFSRTGHMDTQCTRLQNGKHLLHWVLHQAEWELQGQQQSTMKERRWDDCRHTPFGHNTKPCNKSETGHGCNSLFLTKGWVSNISADGRRTASFCKQHTMKFLNSGEASGGGEGGSPRQIAHIRVGQSGFSPGCKHGKRPIAHSRRVRPRLHISAE